MTVHPIRCGILCNLLLFYTPGMVLYVLREDRVVLSDRSAMEGKRGVACNSELCRRTLHHWTFITILDHLPIIQRGGKLIH